VRKLSRNVNIWVFFIGGEGLILPMILAKLLRKRIILVVAGIPEKSAEFRKDILSKPTKILGKINIKFSNKIVLYSKNIIKERALEKYRAKITITHRHYVDLNSFWIKRTIDERKNVVGYIGRLSEEKGILNLIEAIPAILKIDKEISFLIGGDGSLLDRITEYIHKKSIKNKVKMIGWIPHKKLSKYLNKLKLIVIPSYTEGLPNIMLEAMACGTPVLVSPVGGILDVIEHGKNGFLLKNNSPECIANSVLYILKLGEINHISNNARKTVEKNFTYEVVVNNYKKLLKNI